MGILTRFMRFSNIPVTKIPVLINFYPPYLGAGISVRQFAPDLKWIDVQMKMRWYNRNYFGAHFGGSLFSMTDPWYVFILLHRLGPDYTAISKQTKIRFIKPGKGTVHAKFEVKDDEVLSIKEVTDRDGRSEPEFLVYVRQEDGNVVAELDVMVAVRRKDYLQAKKLAGSTAPHFKEHPEGLKKLHMHHSTHKKES